MPGTSAVNAPYLTPFNANNEIVTITASTYTLSMVDLGRLLVFNSASAQTVTIPAGLTKWFTCAVLRIGAGAVTLATGTGATVNSSGLSVVPRYTPLNIIGYDTSTYAIGGNDAPALQTTSVTIATTGNTDAYIVSPVTGNLSGATFSGVDALTTNDTNYITWSITNLGQAGAGSAAMLATSPAGINTTKATGGTAIAANTAYPLTLSATAANLAVTTGDRLRVRYAATGTLANTVTFAVTVLNFSR